MFNGFRDRISAGPKEEKDTHKYINSYGDMCDLCKLGECISAGQALRFFRAETQKLILSEKEKGS